MSVCEYFHFKQDICAVECEFFMHILVPQRVFFDFVNEIIVYQS